MMIVCPFVASGMLPLILAAQPFVVVLTFWGVARTLRFRRRRTTSKLLEEAAQKFAHGEDEAAARANSQVLALDPECAPALILRGMIRSQTHRFAEAVVDFDRAIVLLPRSTLAIYRRAIAKHCLGDLDGAIADYDRVMALEPECADSQPGAGRRRRDFHGSPSVRPHPRYGADRH